MPPKKKPAGKPKASAAKAAAEDGARLELETKVVSLRDELSTMRQWALGALGEAERRAAELREQNVVLCRQADDAKQIAYENGRMAESKQQALQEEKRLKLIVYGQTMTKHKGLEDEMATLQQLLAAEQESRSAAERQTMDHGQSKEALKARLSQLEREFEQQLVAQQEQTMAMRFKCKQESDSLNEQVRLAEEKNASLHQDNLMVNEARQALELRVADLESSESVKDRQVEETRAQMHKMAGQLDSQAAASQQLTAEKHDLELGMARATEEIRSATSASEILNHKHADLGQNMKQIEDAHAAVQSQSSQVSEQLAAVERKREEADAEVRRLLPFAALPGRLSATEEKLEAAQTAIGSLEAQLAGMTRRHDDKSQQLAVARQSFAEKEGEWGAGRRDLETSLRSTTDVCQARVDGLEAELARERSGAEAARDQCSQLEELGARMRELGGKSEERIHSQAKQLEELKQQLAAKQLETSRFDGTIQELTKHISALESNATDQKTRLVKVRSRLQLFNQNQPLMHAEPNCLQPTLPLPMEVCCEARCPSVPVGARR